MRYLLIAISVYCSIFALAQKKPKLAVKPPVKKETPAPTPPPVRVKYDEFKDRTTVILDLSFTASNIARPVEMEMFFDYQGKQFTSAPSSIGVIFSTYSEPGSVHGFSSSSNEWLAIVDGQREAVGRMRYSVSAASGRPGLIADSLSMSTMRDFLTRIAKASQIRMKVGLLEFTLDDAGLKAFREFMEKSEPSK